MHFDSKITKKHKVRQNEENERKYDRKNSENESAREYWIEVWKE